MIASIIFYLFAAVLIASAVMVVSVRNPVYAVLFLILCFFNASGLFVLMGAEFLALILLVVYVGAVAVLFLFVVMMLDVSKNAKQQFRRYMPAGLGVALVLFAQLALVLGSWAVDPGAVRPVVKGAGQLENTKALGRALFTDYLYPFEVSGLILLVAMMGAIVLTLRSRSDARRQNPKRQTGISVAEAIEVRKVPFHQGVDP
ncbi:MAG: NADH-quinone oxidoreductase subunit J [Alphaproteobacteria bacterium]|nr:NADH-quinone oxidoreductase subunit J [Alphaproteobacteria bacterium]